MKRMGQLFCMIMVGIAMVGSANADLTSQTIYLENFAGSGNNSLNGKVPDVGANAWAAHSIWTDDGRIGGAGAESGYLPFIPEAGKRYVLSGTLTVLGTGTNWVGVGFAKVPTISGNMAQASADGVGWFFKRGDGSGTTFLARNGGGVNYTGALGITDFRIVLDTRPAKWTVEWFFAPSGEPLVSVRGPVEFTTNPSIQCLMLNTYSQTAKMDLISLKESELYNAWAPEGMVPSGDVTLSWEFADYAPVVDVWYGTNPEAMTLLLDNEPNTTTSVTILDLPINETYYWRIDPYLNGTSADPNTGDTWTFTTFDASFAVDAGADMATWSAEPVVMNPSVNGAGAPSVAWTADAASLADPNLLVAITNANQLNATVTLTLLNGAVGPKTVTMTIDASTQYAADADSMTVTVYEDACAVAYSLGQIDPGNIAGDDCVTDLTDLAEMAGFWLNDSAPLAPVAIPQE